MDEKTGAAGSHVNYDEPVVRIEGLKKAFDDNVVLRDVNLEVYRGEVVVILRSWASAAPPCGKR